MNLTKTAPESETVVPLTSRYPVARVDLMPPEILERRRFVTAQWWMALALVVTVGGVGGGYALSATESARAERELAAEQARTVQLEAEAAQYAEIPLLLASIDRAETALETSMATDVQWYAYLSQIGQSASPGVWFDSVTASALVPGALAADPLAPQDAVAEIVTSGHALSYPDVATWLDDFDAVTGLDHVLVAQATLDEDTGDQPWVDFSMSTKVEPQAYSNRYSRGARE